MKTTAKKSTRTTVIATKATDDETFNSALTQLRTLSLLVIIKGTIRFLFSDHRRILKRLFSFLVIGSLFLIAGWMLAIILLFVTWCIIELLIFLKTL